MKIEFSYIKNRIGEYKKDELIDYSYKLLDLNNSEFKLIWFIFLLMKWTYLYGGQKYPPKRLTPEKFNHILNCISNFNNDHILNFFKEGKIDRAMNIFYSQQFYLKKNVTKEVFAIQLKLYNSINGRYNIDNSFINKTGLSVLEFLYISQLIWLYVESRKHEVHNLNYSGYLEKEFLILCRKMTSETQIENFIELTVLNTSSPIDKIKKFKRNIKREDLQSMERTFFTMYPFQSFNGKIKVLHESVLNHFLNYYIYDFLKSNDDNFTTEFGHRFEKYIEESLKELNISYVNENQLKKKLKINSNLVDFHLDESNVYIECKAIELQPIPLINPTDEILYNSLKDSILKAYFRQLLNVSKSINNKKENWGLIITYKELYWSQFSELYEISKDRFENSEDSHFLPPENVFILDIYSWNSVLQIIKDGKATIIEILEKARLSNSKLETRKQAFWMHLDEYKLTNSRFDFLKKEIEQLHIRKTDNKN